MNRAQFDSAVRGTIQALHLLKDKIDKQKELRGLVEEYMRSLDESGRWSLIEDYVQFAAEKRTVVRDYAQTLAPLCQLRKLEPDFFDHDSGVQGVISFLNSDLDYAARQYTNAEQFVTLLSGIQSDIHKALDAQRRQAAPSPVRGRTLPKRGGNTR